ncbi:MAG: FtsH protease activity modulator HflK [Gammaproteobacteria bacterium]|nr:FtsH protease activity modulator HflK [Gammaproteobacteria bacterium]MBU1732323.1 FtsH protease activity modulator HflK [Gammaproteobacteria bacterium]MBU1893893.1 FtsH protease activity modulator HflK [Gammaproteobacteria bacterium]
MAWNDPDWGKKNSGGPPDLDELWRKFNQRLNSMFGGKGPSSGGGAPTPIGPKAFGGMGLIAALALLVWIGSGFYIVNAGERGVVLRFGKFLETTQSGPRWHLPYPFESVEVVNVEQVRTVEVGYRNNVKSKILKESLMLTDDENIIDIQFAVQYILKSPEEFLFNNRHPEDAVLNAAETAIREIVGKNKMNFVLYEGRAEVAARATKLMQEILDRYKTGINISKVTMQNAQPPEQVQAAFDDAVKAGQDKERQKNEGQAYANDVVPKARGAASRLLEEADGYKQRVIASAEGDASRFKQIVSEYNKAPVVTRDRMYLDAMQQMLSSTSKVLVDQKGGNNLLYLPLDKLIQHSAPDTSVAKPIPQPESAPSADSTSRSRDAFRSRDRETR